MNERVTCFYYFNLWNTFDERRNVSRYTYGHVL